MSARPGAVGPAHPASCPTHKTQVRSEGHTALSTTAGAQRHPESVMCSNSPHEPPGEAGPAVKRSEGGVPAQQRPDRGLTSLAGARKQAARKAGDPSAGLELRVRPPRSRRMEARTLGCCSGKKRQWGHGRVLSVPSARGLELAGVSRSSEAKVSCCNCPAPLGHTDSPKEERPERSRGRERESGESAEDLLKLPKNQPLPRNNNRNGFPSRQHHTDQELLPRGAWGPRGGHACLRRRS